MKFDPHDPDLALLARDINKRLLKYATQGSVSFFSVDGTYSLIMQAGARRAVIRLRGRPTDGDADDIVQALHSWAGFKDESAAYSTTLPEPPATEWP